MRYLLLLIPLLILSLTVSGEPVTVTGSTGGNVNSPVRIYRYSDMVTMQEIFIASMLPDVNGRFAFTVDNEGVNEYFVRNGIHENHFFLDNGEDIDLVLYQYIPIPQSALQNPFFEYIRVYAGSSMGSDLNNRILNFEAASAEATDIITRALSGRGEAVDTDSLLNCLVAESEGNAFFSNWVTWRVARLELLPVRDRDSRREIVLALEDSFDPGNRACTEMVQAVYQNLLRELSSEAGGNIIRETIRAGSTAAPLASYANSAGGIMNREMIEFILVQSLYREYYNNYFDREGSYSMIRWLGRNAQYQSVRDIALLAGEKLRKFIPGSPLPAFSLPGADANSWSPASWRGKFLLLNFGRSDSWSTISEFGLLKQWHTQYGEYLAIVTILCDDDYQAGLEKMRTGGFDWMILDGSEAVDVSDMYEVKYFPSFYLADSQGNIILAPAPFPSENLLQILLEKLIPYLPDNIPQR